MMMVMIQIDDDIRPNVIIIIYDAGNDGNEVMMQVDKGKGSCLESRVMTTHVQQTLYFPWQVGCQLMQPATIDPTLDLCTKHPLWLDGQRQCGI